MDSYKLENFDFDLPEDRIRKYPLEKRESSKLLIVDKKGNIISDTNFENIINFIDSESLLVFNDSKVLKSRIFGQRKKNNKIIEILIIKRIKINLFLALVKNTKSFKEGEIILIVKKFEDRIEFTDYSIRVEGREEDGLLISFNVEIDFDTIENFGKLPIPPYLKRQSNEIDEIYYQNVFAKVKGSVASPTAALHFSEKLISKLKEKNIEITYITLHIGWGTFAPIRTEDVRQHKIHKEWFTINKESADKINDFKRRNKKIIACGTTTLRALEGCFYNHGKIENIEDETSIFIYPPFNFKVVDGLITNFHTPKSSLLLLVSAFAGYDNIKKYYDYALKNDYMFFSYGDAMYIIP